MTSYYRQETLQASPKSCQNELTDSVMLQRREIDTQNHAASLYTDNELGLPVWR